MRIAFLGTPASAVPFLDALIEADHDVVLVVTRPDRPVGRSGEPRATPVKVRAADLGIEVVQPRTARGPKFVGRLRSLSLDVSVVVAFGRILTRPVLDAARLGAVNVHFSLLPRYRGAAPVQWALAEGETETGVCTMALDEGLDTGDVLGVRRVPIEPGEHAPALQARLVEAGRALLLETLEGLDRGTVRPRAQDPGRATYAPVLSPADGRVDPAMPARALEGRVRGFDPWPGVWMRRGRRRVRLLDAEAVDTETVDAPPGTVVRFEGDALWIACGAGTVLAVRELQVEGRRPTAARDAVNGRQLVPGDRLEPIEP